MKLRRRAIEVKMRNEPTCHSGTHADGPARRVRSCADDPDRSSIAPFVQTKPTAATAERWGQLASSPLRVPSSPLCRRVFCSWDALHPNAALCSASHSGVQNEATDKDLERREIRVFGVPQNPGVEEVPRLGVREFARKCAILHRVGMACKTKPSRLAPNTPGSEVLRRPGSGMQS